MALEVRPLHVRMDLEGLGDALTRLPELRQLPKFTWNGEAVQVKGKFGAESLELEICPYEDNWLAPEVSSIELRTSELGKPVVQANFSPQGLVRLDGLNLAGDEILLYFHLPGYGPDEE